MNIRTLRAALPLLALAFAAAPAQALSVRSDVTFPANVPVCWQASSGTVPNEAHWQYILPTYLDESWGRATNLTFTFANPCPTSGSRILIGLQASGSSTTSLAVSGGTTVSTVRITPPATLTAADEDAFRYQVMRNFGLALGFSRQIQPLVAPTLLLPDPTLACTQVIPSGSIVLGTANDPFSVLNDCASRRATLSPWDVFGARIRFGFKQPGTLLAHRNLALENGSFTSPSPSVKLNRYATTSSANQAWRFLYLNAATLGQHSVLGTTLGSASYYLGSADGWATRTDSLFYPDQDFSFRNVEVRGIGDLCLTHLGATPVSGARIEIRQCSGAANQKWTADAWGSLRAGTSSLCLTATTAQAGELLQLAPCAYSATQYFVRDDAGKLRRGSGLCVNAQWGDPVDGRLVQLYPCTAGAQNEHWHFRGPVVSDLFGRCLELTGYTASIGVNSRLATCAGNPTQIWEYYFHN